MRHYGVMTRSAERVPMRRSGTAAVLRSLGPSQIQSAAIRKILP